MNVGHTYESVARLVRAVLGEAPSAAELPGKYRETLSKLRPMPADQEGLHISYENGAWADHCTVNKIFAHIFKGASVTDGPTRKDWETKVVEALDLIHEISPELRHMVDFLVTDVVVVNTGADGGGSASHIPGVVVMSPGREWDVLDYAMCLVHEGMHLNLFVGDAVYGTFTLPSTVLEEDQYRALSAVKIGQKRPLDKAFHAAIVTVPLMYMEQHQGRTNLVRLYTESLRDACTDLDKQRPHFTEYGRLLLDELIGFGETIDFASVERSIRSVEFAGYRPALAA
ncbi:HEXXH motif-containing putative peptide modification protein [Streptomyces sp. NPDC050095]|uniref:aKG-HExxH-type peptide beta-hydroxylase n=1 Tax=unclassified Streptomyces TaxID=2593676 RepID=UPI00343AE150